MDMATVDFLEAILFVNSGEPEDDLPAGCKVGDFSGAFIKEANKFVWGFGMFLAHKGIDIYAMDFSEQSFGADVYFSLSGHGVGFWARSDPAIRALNDLLIEYSGDPHRFENMDLIKRKKIDLAYQRPYIKQYRTALFAVKE